MRRGLFAAQAALELVQTGVPFRQVYRQVADALRSGQFKPPPSSALTEAGIENVRLDSFAICEYTSATF
jgi:hypothetical protein